VTGYVRATRRGWPAFAVNVSGLYVWARRPHVRLWRVAAAWGAPYAVRVSVRVRSASGIVIDVAAALSVTVVLLGATRLAVHGEVGGVGYALIAVAGLCLAAVRRAPRAVLAFATAVGGAYVAYGAAPGPVLAVPLVALVAVSVRGDRRSAAVGAVVLCAVLAVAGMVAGLGVALAGWFVSWCAAAVLLGEFVGRRRAELEALRARNEMLERSREEEARRRIAEDRLSIARDLHDSVAHALAIINVQAAAAGEVLARDADAAGDALGHIRRASRDALEELTGLLTVLREPQTPATRAPAPGLAALEDLIAQSDAERLTVSLCVHGELDLVPAPVGTAAYRIIQESLTNVLRHADARRADVRVDAGARGALSLSIVDDGRGVADGNGGGAPRSLGAGLRGMRERAEASGGRLTAGPRPQGGFAVRASWSAAR
jgi:signal transduction histidine kinase